MFAKKRWMLQKEFSFIISCEKCERCFMGSLPFYCFREYPIKNCIISKGCNDWLFGYLLQCIIKLFAAVFLICHFSSLLRLITTTIAVVPYLFGKKCKNAKMQKCKNAKMQKCKKCKNAKYKRETEKLVHFKKYFGYF